MTMDENDLEKYNYFQTQQYVKWENACRRCGACCGKNDGDPCEHLVVKNPGQTFCGIYEQRFGLRKTISGQYFQCVPLRQILHDSWPGDWSCVYKRGRPI
jgi:hypothetical protein